MDSNGSHKPLVNVTDMSQEQIENMLRQMADMRAEMESYKKELYGLRQVVKGQSSVMLPQVTEEATSRRKLLKRVATGAAGLGALALAANVNKVAMADTPTDTGVEVLPGPDGYGLKATGGAAPIWLVPSTSAGSPTTTTSARNIGELYVDSNGELFYCVVGGSGTAAKWRNISGPSTAGSLHFLPTANRFADTRTASVLNTTAGAIQPGTTKVVTVAGVNGRDSGPQIPLTATGVVGSIGIVSPAGNGTLKVFPGGFAGTPATTGTATTGYFGAGVATAFNAVLGTGANAGQLLVYCAGAATDFVIDLVGYYL